MPELGCLNGEGSQHFFDVHFCLVLQTCLCKRGRHVKSSSRSGSVQCLVLLVGLRMNTTALIFAFMRPSLIPCSTLVTTYRPHNATTSPTAQQTLAFQLLDSHVFRNRYQDDSNMSQCANFFKKSMECRVSRGQPNHVQVQPRWQAYRLGSGCHDL